MRSRIPRPGHRPRGRLLPSLMVVLLPLAGCSGKSVPPPPEPAAPPLPPAAASASPVAEPAATPEIAAPSLPPLPQPPPPIHDSHVHLTPVRPVVDLSLQIFARNGIDRFAVKSAGSVGSRRYLATLELADILGRRLAFFVNPDWTDHDSPGWGEREAARLEQAMQDGASGIKFFKALGLGVRDAQGRLWPADTPRLDPVWRKAGELGAIVALHIGDPRAFFQPPTPDNERYEELKRAPSWSFHGGDYPSWETLLAQQENLFARFPQTVFLGIHLAGAAEDLALVGRLLDTYPNLYVDTSARLGEIGRHPQEETRAFFLRYQDRILFGSDLIVSPDGLQLGSVSLDDRPPGLEEADRFYQDHRRFFETAARRIPHPTPSQGAWTIDGIGLPPEVLAKIYRTNAEKLIFAKRDAWWDGRHPRR